MDKKKLTSWGVSFSSLALVAGMVGYLGLANKNVSSNSTASASSQVTQQASTQSGNNKDSSFTFNQTTNNNTQSSSGDHAFSGHHGNFDTTTGGS